MQIHNGAAESMQALLGKGLPGPILQSLPAVCPAAASIVHGLPLVIQVIALHAPPDLIPLHSSLMSAQADLRSPSNVLKLLLCAVSLPRPASVH